MSNQESLDIDWLAARFVLDELDEEASSKCERLLESDQAFREAVARAVELLQATSHAMRHSAKAPVRSRSWSSLVAGISVGIAASFLLALAVSLAGFVHIGPRLAGQRSSDDAPEASENPSVVLQWSERVRLDETEAEVVDNMPVVATEEIDQPDQPAPPSPWIVAIAKLPEEPDDAEPQDGSDG